jgi:CRISPR-associated protein Cas5t
MKTNRIIISSWTASFRYPNLISGFQPTLEVPPISTVLGLLNAAAGRYIEHKQIKIGYYFTYEAKTIDLETIYQIEIKTGANSNYPSNVAKSNVINREILFNCKLYLYLNDEDLVDYFRKPYYQLVLGRSNDLATVEAIEEVRLTENHSPENLTGQIIPFTGNFLAGEIQALPKYFSNTIPRNNFGTEPYSVISCNAGKSDASILTYTDEIDGQKVDIYFHDLDF